jgi:hypothetical protein
MTDGRPPESSWDWVPAHLSDVRVCNCVECRRELVSDDDLRRILPHVRNHLTPRGFVTPELFAGCDRFGRPYCWPCWNRRVERIGRSFHPVGPVGLVPWEVPVFSLGKAFRWKRGRDDGADGDPGWDDAVRCWEDDR